ncbi:MAG: ATP-dependent DNA helicase RecG [Lachnospiraceae bacterium]|nr:ATP-dependent DNA helicase RecG [Lachnospiraceae bacterium]
MKKEKKESLRTLKGIGEKIEKLFAKSGVTNLNQLLHYYPRDYDFYKQTVAIGMLKDKEKNAVFGRIVHQGKVQNYNKQSITILHLEDETGKLQIIWFHMPFLKNILKKGRNYIFRGRVLMKNGRKTMEHPEIFTIEGYAKIQKKFRPVYPLTTGLTNKMVIKAISQLLQKRNLNPEYLPKEQRERYRLCENHYAIAEIHFPSEQNSLLEARRRLVFDEFFFFLLALRRLKKKTETLENHFPMRRISKTEKVIKNLPYRLTSAQIIAWNELKQDMTGQFLMHRLIQGDVGSGKTILAFLTMIMCYENGYQSALMVPTEVLAVQHYESLCCLLKKNQITDAHPVLLKGHYKQKANRKIYEKIASGETKMIIGTHTLIQKKVVYRDLALAITDEQHRFGVRQRTLLTEKGYPPNVLVMSATPIPRTLAIILYADLDISVLNELPAHRLPIKNCVVGTSWRPNAYQFMKQEIAAGHQVYVICPMVEENEALHCENVTDYSNRMREQMPIEIRVEPIHSQMNAKKKNEILKAFAANKIQILVSTTVVEVGINVPNATVMLIENVERFGLAQLHQLRGRVGRGEAQSYCIFMQGNEKKETSQRLNILNKSNDGFYIAEEDLKLRGQGDLFGIRQSGIANFKIANIYQDADILKESSAAVYEILKLDPELKLPQNRLLNVALEHYLERQNTKILL